MLAEDAQDALALARTIEYAALGDGVKVERLLRAAARLRREAGETDVAIAQRHLDVIRQIQGRTEDEH